LINAVLSSGSGFIRNTLSFLFFIYASRKLGPTLWGTLRSAGALVDLFSRFSDLGCSTVAVRRIARNPDAWPETLWTATWTRLGLASLSALLPMLAGWLLQYPHHIMKLACILALASIPTSFGTSLSLVFNGLERFHLATTPGLLTHLLYMASRAEAVRRGKSLPILVLLTLLQGMVLCVMSWWILFRSLGTGIRKLRGSSMIELLRESIPFAASGLLASIYWQVDMVMLQRLKDETEVGIYSAAYGFVNVGMRICAGLGAALLPAFSRRAQNKTQELSAPFLLAIKLSLVLGLPTALGIQILAPDLLGWLLSSDYAHSGTVLSVLIWSVFFILMNTVLYNALYALGKERFVIALFASMVLINITANAVLIPIYSYMGAAGTTVLCEALNFLCCFLYLRNRLSLGHVKALHLLFLGPGAAVAVCLFLTQPHWGLLSAFLGLGAFLASAPLCLFAMTKDERNALAGLLPGQGSWRSVSS